MVPASISQNFFEKLLDGIPHYEKNGVFYTNCGIVIRDVYIMFETYWIQIKKEDLLQDLWEDGSICIVNFLPSVDDFWVFGNIIYRDYYVYHNPDKGVMGWVPTEDRIKTALTKDSIPTL